MTQEEDKKQETATSHADALRYCAPFKANYDRCFNSWYRYSFLQGRMGNACDDLFEDYRACILEQLGQSGLENVALFDTPTVSNSSTKDK